MQRGGDGMNEARDARKRLVGARRLTRRTAHTLAHTRHHHPPPPPTTTTIIIFKIQYTIDNTRYHHSRGQREYTLILLLLL